MKAARVHRKDGPEDLVLEQAAEPKADYVRALGAHDMVSYADAGWTERVGATTRGRGVDVAHEMTGGAMFGQTLSNLAPFGRLVVYGAASRESSEPEAPRLVPYNQSVSGDYVSAWFAKRPHAALRSLDQLTELVRVGKVEVRIGKVLPLAEGATAHRLLEGRGRIGKIVPKPWQVVA